MSILLFRELNTISSCPNFVIQFCVPYNYEQQKFVSIISCHVIHHQAVYRQVITAFLLSVKPLLAVPMWKVITKQRRDFVKYVINRAKVYAELLSAFCVILTCRRPVSQFGQSHDYFANNAGQKNMHTFKL